MRDRDPPPEDERAHLEAVDDGGGCMEVAVAISEARDRARLMTLGRASKSTTTCSP